MFEYVERDHNVEFVILMRNVVVAAEVELHVPNVPLTRQIAACFDRFGKWLDSINHRRAIASVLDCATSEPGAKIEDSSVLDGCLYIMVREKPVEPILVGSFGLRLIDIVDRFLLR